MKDNKQVLMLDEVWMTLVECGLKKSTVRLGLKKVTLGETTIISTLVDGTPDIKVRVTSIQHLCFGSLSEDFVLDNEGLTKEALRAFLRLYYNKKEISNSDKVTVISFIKE